MSQPRTDRELMQQALEALEAAEVTGNCFYGVTELLRTRLAQPEQEPVAWVNQANLNSAAIQRNRGGQGDTHTWSETPTWDYSVPLYTTPPQRKPLTDEEIEEVFFDMGQFAKIDLKAFARAIEAAHGIKENT